MNDTTLNKIIDKAIEREEEAYSFYMKLASKVNDSNAKETLKFLANEEVKHKDFLISYKKGSYKNSLQMSQIISYKIAEHIDKPDIEGKLDTKDVYLIAAHRELNSHNFYKELASLQPDNEVKDILLRMANEELKHKEKVEYLYANTTFIQTDGG